MYYYHCKKTGRRYLYWNIDTYGRANYAIITKQRVKITTGKVFVDHVWKITEATFFRFAALIAKRYSLERNV